MITRYNFCPGNMGSYDILYGEVPRYSTCPTSPGCSFNDSPGGGYLLVWLNKGGSGGGAFRFDDGVMACAGYLMEKMGIRLVGDANALLAFLRQQGHRVQIDGPFWDDDGNYIPAKSRVTPDPDNVHRL